MFLFSPGSDFSPYLWFYSSKRYPVAHFAQVIQENLHGPIVSITFISSPVFCSSPKWVPHKQMRYSPNYICIRGSLKKTKQGHLIWEVLPNHASSIDNRRGLSKTFCSGWWWISISRKALGQVPQTCLWSCRSTRAVWGGRAEPDESVNWRISPARADRWLAQGWYPRCPLSRASSCCSLRCCPHSMGTVLEVPASRSWPQPPVGTGTWCYPHLASVPASLAVLSSSQWELFPSLLVLLSMKVSSAQFVIFFKEMKVWNASLRRWHGVMSRRGHRPHQGMFGGARWCSVLLEVKTQQTHPPQPAYSIVFPGILRRRKASWNVLVL